MEIILAKPKSEKDPRQEYVLLLLEAALNYKQTQPPIKIVYSDTMHSRERLKALLKEGRAVNIQATATRPDWEEDLLTIRIPIFKGLLGYRLLLIHKDQQPKFSAVRHIEQLKSLTAILGSQWSITPIWKGYGFNTITNVDYESLFRIIHFNRADYFPRGANEILQEYNKFHPDFPNLAIENDLAIYLPLPLYFFVTPHKPNLAKRLEENMERMIADGEFDRFFMQNYGRKVNQLRINKRLTFFLENPNLPEKTPLERKELWYSTHKGNTEPLKENIKKTP